MTDTGQQSRTVIFLLVALLIFLKAMTHWRLMKKKNVKVHTDFPSFHWCWREQLFCLNVISKNKYQEEENQGPILESVINFKGEPGGEWGGGDLWPGHTE